MKLSRLVLSPHEPLVERAAEEFERQIQTVLAGGHHNLIIDLSEVPRIDEAGIRGLVRGYITAQRVGGSVRVVGANADVRAFLESLHLGSVFPMLDSIEAAQTRDWPWQAIAFVIGAVAFCAALVWGGEAQPESALTNTSPLDGSAGAQTTFPGGPPVLALIKLIAATGIGLLVTAVHRPSLREKPLNRSMEQAQVLDRKSVV